MTEAPSEKTFYNLLKKYELLCSLKCNNKSLSTVKSHIMFEYMRRVAPLLFWKSKLLPPRKFAKSVRCQWCLNEWREGQFSMKLQAEKRPKPNLCRLFMKDKSKLNKYQLKLVSKYKERWHSNALILLCNTCCKETTVYIQKPNKGGTIKPADGMSSAIQEDIMKGKKMKPQITDQEPVKKQKKKQITIQEDIMKKTKKKNKLKRLQSKKKWNKAPFHQETKYRCAENLRYLDR